MAKVTIASTMAILVVLLAGALPAALGDANFVANTCKSSDNPQCVAVLTTEPRSMNATTARELASIALDIAADEARASSGYLSGEAEKRDRTDAGDALSECVGHYGRAIDALETAREDFDGGAFDEAEKDAGEAEAAADECEQAFTDRRLTSIVSDVNKRMKDKASVASDLIDLLWGDKLAGRRLLRRP